MPSLTLEEINRFSTLPTYNFVETGTYLGDTVNTVLNKFENIYTIELSQKYFDIASKRFEHASNVEVIKGDSSIIMNILCERLDKATFFWLDGHYSSGDTARGSKDCPLLEEIDAIVNKCHPACVIAIDDVRLFNKKLDEDWTYITNEEILNRVKSRIVSLNYFPSTLDPRDRMIIQLAPL